MGNDHSEHRGTLTIAAFGRVAGVLLLVVGVAPGQPRLVDVTEEAGVDFVHDPGSLAGFPLPAILGGGTALFDADGDGILDLYLIQSGSEGNRFFRGDGEGRFRDRSAESGLGDASYGFGVAIGDADGDGDSDVFLSNLGEDALYLGEDGRFERAEAAGLTGSRWSASAAFCDYDGDRDLDLYVGGYVVDDPLRQCVSSSGQPDFCEPASLPYERDTLYRNRGDGTFEDVSQAAGILARRLPALGVLCHDFTGDGRPDFYVANDGEPNLLWEQLPDGAFEDSGLLMGLALNGQGRTEASMGVLLGDFDQDADLDLFMTHLRSQTNTLYRNQGNTFVDSTASLGLGVPSLPWTGFGTAFFDIEHDGDADLLVVNGAVARASGAAVAPNLESYREPAQAFLSDGEGRFQPAEAGDFTALSAVGRGLATGDWDRDGDLDLVVTAVGGAARLFENRSERAGDFVILELREFSRPSPGAVVTLELEDRTLVRAVNPEAGYLTSSEPVAHFGIPAGAVVTGARVRWPDGTKEEFPAPPVGARTRWERKR